MLRFEQHVCGKGNLPESNATVSKSTAGAKACVAGVRKGRTWGISEMKFLFARAYAEGVPFPGFGYMKRNRFH